MTLETTATVTAEQDGWRIDELAQRAGVAVDTIRYYQREGLLRSGERVGRSHRYGPEHLERLERIRGLQARRFSLAAIHALLDHEGPIDSLLAARGGASYDRGELVEAAGTTDAFVDALERAGFLVPPSELARDLYDGDDVEALRALRDLAELGVPDDVLVAIAVVASERTEEMYRTIVQVFTKSEAPGWDDEAKAEFGRAGYDQPDRLVRPMRAVLSYAEHRSGQRVVLEQLQHAEELPRG